MARSPLRRLLVAVLVVFAVLASARAQAADRRYRVLDSGDGLPVSHVDSLAEDAEGFIWVGTAAGLARMDGARIVPWGTDRLRVPVYRVATGPRPGQVALDANGEAWEVRGDSVERIGPEGAPLSSVFDLGFAPDGALWVADASGLWRRGVGGDWTRPLRAHPVEAQVRRLQRDGDRLLLMTDREIWSLASDGRPFHLVDADRAHSLVHLPGGDLLVQQRMGHLLRVSPQGSRRTLPFGPLARGMDMVRRGDTVWVAVDRGLYAWREGQEPELLGPDQGVWSGGPLLVDHEGSLWLGTFRGLLVMPEPDTETWTERDGLPLSHTRSVALTGDRLWVTTWAGLGWVRFGRDPAAGTWTELLIKSRICSDGFGRAWGMGRRADDESMEGVAELSQDGAVFHVLPGARPWTTSCAQRPDGTLWLVADIGVFRTRPEGGPLVRVAPLPGTHRGGPHAVVEGVDGRLWLSTGSEVCRTEGAVADLDLTEPAAWTCEEVGSQRVDGLAELPGGAIWAASRHDGLFRSTPSGGWERLPGADALKSWWYEDLVPSPRGGVWITTQEGLVRAVERTELAAGWQILERLPGREGAIISNAVDVVEEPEGTLWVASNAGVTRVPARVRNARAPEPALRLVSARLDGREVAVRGVVTASRPGCSLDLDLAALSHQDPQHIAYRMRVGPGDAWLQTGREGTFHLVSLPPGRHRLELAASLDGAHWSETAAPLVVVVPRPWYARAWVQLGAVLLVSVIGVVVHQVRVRSLLRLEQLRTRVAMDLHDELGSGLGSIGLLAGLARSGGLPGDAVADVAGRISSVAGELSASLSGIVWSLGDHAESLDGLARHLTERGERLFPGAPGQAELVTRFPSPLPTGALSLPVARAVQRIAVEALHNAARHAGASRVELGLAPEGRRWRLWVVDDGRGPGAGERPGSLGRRSMRGRADEIGATLHWGEAPGGGTRVEVIFTPRIG